MDDIYCKECGSCGEDGCCSALRCAYHNMVEKSTGLHCKIHFKDIEFSHKLSTALYNKYEDKELFDKIYDEIYRKED